VSPAPSIRACRVGGTAADPGPADPARRLGHVEEIAAMVRLLVGPEGTFITGQTIHVNGGEFLT
jgi:3-oxoacyl-[acyl-carrier protein] reductase